MPWRACELLSFIGSNPMSGGFIVALAVSIPHPPLPMNWSVAAAALTLALSWAF